MARFMNMDAVGGTCVQAGVCVWFHLRIWAGICVWLGISHSLVVVGARGHLSKEVPMGPCGRSSIVVAGGHSH